MNKIVLHQDFEMHNQAMLIRQTKTVISKCLEGRNANSFF